MNKAKKIVDMLETHGRGRKFGDPGTEGPVILSDEKAFSVMSEIIGGISIDDLDLKGSDFVARKLLDQLNKMNVKLMKE